MKKFLYIVLNTKGGVGKSTIVSLLFQFFLLTLRRSVKLLDCDESNSTTCALHPEAEFVPRTVDVDGRRLFDRLYEATEDAEVVLADMPSTSAEYVLTWLRGAGVLDAAAESGVQVVIVCPVCNDVDSVASVKAMHADLGRRVSWVIVKNEKDGATAIWDGSKTRETILADGAEEVIMQAYTSKAAASSLKSSGKCFTNALNSSVWSLLERNRQRAWLNRLFAEFEASKLLNP